MGENLPAARYGGRIGPNCWGSLGERILGNQAHSFLSHRLLCKHKQPQRVGTCCSEDRLPKHSLHCHPAALTTSWKLLSCLTKDSERLHLPKQTPTACPHTTTTTTTTKRKTQFLQETEKWFCCPFLSDISCISMHQGCIRACMHSQTYTLHLCRTWRLGTMTFRLVNVKA